MKAYTYLALGDSYTVGEQVRLTESYPYQTVQFLRNGVPAALNFHAPEIVAVTGFTTAELRAEINRLTLQSQYDIVTLLIGVNNQYRGLSIDVFREEFYGLLLTAIQFAGGNSSRVVVLSIPDWGVTPFAADRDRAEIAAAIDAYNFICREAAAKEGAHYIDITEAQRQNGSRLEYLAGDQLHPSGKEYQQWAQRLSNVIATILPETTTEA